MRPEPGRYATIHLPAQVHTGSLPAGIKIGRHFLHFDVVHVIKCLVLKNLYLTSESVKSGRIIDQNLFGDIGAAPSVQIITKANNMKMRISRAPIKPLQTL